jgi:hypothetical protein
MSKRTASEAQTHTKRKRKKNGVSKSCSVLEPVPHTVPMATSSRLMPVFHTNAEDPSSVRRSTVPVLSKPQSQRVLTETDGGDFSTVLPTPVRSKRRRKRGNDSVSRHIMQATDRVRHAQLLSPFDRRRWRCGFYFGQRYWKNLRVTTAFRSTHPHLNVLVVSMNWERTDASTVLL